MCYFISHVMYNNSYMGVCITCVFPMFDFVLKCNLKPPFHCRGSTRVRPCEDKPVYRAKAGRNRSNTEYFHFSPRFIPKHPVFSDHEKSG